MEKHDGKCDPPDRRGKMILIDSRITGERELDTLIHEMLHAADWSKDEAWVSGLASDMARVLSRLGYARPSGKPKRRKLLAAAVAKSSKRPTPSFLDRLPDEERKEVLKLRRQYQAGLLRRSLADLYTLIRDEGIDLGIRPPRFREWMNER